jgi:DNA-binding transcriptional regulator/RsmH inhibitor MraZ
VSQELFKSIGVAKKVLVVGMGHYMELWSPEKYESGQKDLSAPDPEFLDQFFF